ncbi:NACHT domain-containing protein [Kitasatospora sp. NPDC058965]|uniref:NACHT domain-containing protein n=1 Tax=Kitasatospora sp. NPDC058965 TaxID=3346682 RepID=UPI00368B9200
MRVRGRSAPDGTPTTTWVENTFSGTITHGDLIQAGNVFIRHLPGPQDWATELARQVLHLEGTECRRLLGHSLQRIDLSYSLVTEPGRAARKAGPAGRQLTETADAPGIAQYYRELDPGRLVITGAGGAGKTVLAMELMIALLQDRGAGDPVPVRIPLADWPSGIGLADFLADYLHKTYRWPKRKARRLVREQRVLPVLDGLDEMDPPLPNGKPDPAAPRARAALRAINGLHTGLRPGAVILTCRTEAYDTLAKGQHDPEARRLLDAARIEVERIEPTTALAYLTERAAEQDRWQPLLKRLAAQPRSPLARLLSTPWRLCLVARSYATDGDPAELTRFRDPEQLDRHLLNRYVPALLKPDPAQPAATARHHPADVHRWLHQLARHLATAGGGTESRAVLTLHELWRMRPRPARRVQTCAILLVGAVFGFLAPLLPLDHPADADLASTIVVWEVLALCYSRTPVARRPRSLRLSMTGWTWPALVFLLLMAVGAAALFHHSLPGHLPLVSAVLMPLSTLAAVSYVNPSKPARSPRTVLREDLVAGVVGGLLTGLGAPFGLGHDAHDIAVLAVAEGVFITLTFTGGLYQLHLAFLLASRRRLPLRLGPFLDWATGLGLLRLAGPAYQFRHRELQTWLAANPQPPALDA